MWFSLNVMTRAIVIHLSPLCENTHMMTYGGDIIII